MSRPARELPADDDFGPWRALEVLGEGQSGRVLLARRADLDDGRRVAIKTLHSPSAGALARFELERQALARLEHPAIARLYDAGVSAAGLPYVVLEHVDGLPIDLYCEREKLDREARLRLFIEVCRGVGHAHRNLIVHRDLKPANILVDRDGRPRLVDFGIARLLDAPPEPEAAPSASLLAEATARTPAYASPEQILGGPITTATDVFSLGTVLYELLAGRSPWPDLSRHQLERSICAADPPPASRAARAAGMPAREARRLSGELDAILAKALARDPADRYPSVDALARDLESHLGHRPLLARPPGAVATVGLFLRRHLGASLAAALLAAALGVFLAVLGRQAADLRAERDNARRTLAFLIDIFHAEPPAGSSAGAGAPAMPTARQLLARGAARVEKELAGQNAAQATLLVALGQVHHQLGFYEEAVGLQRRAAEKLAGGDELELATARHHLGRALVSNNDAPGGEMILRGALEARRRRLPAGSPELIDDLTELADALEIQGPAFLKEAIELRREAAGLAAGAQPAKRLVVLGSLGRALAVDRQFAEAARVNDQAWALAAATPDEPSDKLAEGIFEVGVAMVFNGDRRSLPLYERALAIRRQVLPADHPRLLENEQGIALALLEEQRWAEARVRLEKVVEGKRRRLGKDHYLVFPVELELARCLGELGDWPAATAMAGEVLARAEAAGKAPADLAFIFGRLADFEQRRGRFEIAREHLERAQHSTLVAGMPRAERLQLDIRQAALEVDLGRHEAARRRFERTIGELRREPGIEAWRIAYAQGAYARLLARLGRGAEAVALAESAYDQLSAHFGSRSRNLHWTLVALREAYRATGDRAGGEKVGTWLREPARRPARL